MADEINYGRYTIRTIKKATGWSGRAFRGDKTVGTAQSGKTQAAVVSALEAALDAQEAAWITERGADGFPVAAEVRLALATIARNTAQQAMLMAHLRAPDHVLSAAELAGAAGYKNYETANAQYGTFARKLADALGWQPAAEEDGSVVWTFALATGADGDTRADLRALGLDTWRWRLRPQLVEALALDTQAVAA